MISIEEISAENFESPEDVRALALEARSYLLAHEWVYQIESGSVAWGFSKMSIFHFYVRSSMGPMTTWVIVGEVPPAYIDTAYCANAYEALSGYLAELQMWVRAGRKGASVDRLIPVRNRSTLELLQPTKEIVDDLDLRIKFIADKILNGRKDELEMASIRTQR